jgi:hypothetical protein
LGLKLPGGEIAQRNRVIQKRLVRASPEFVAGYAAALNLIIEALAVNRDSSPLYPACLRMPASLKLIHHKHTPSSTKEQLNNVQRKSSGSSGKSAQRW